MRSPLTQDEIEQRREIVRQKHLERQNASKDSEEAVEENPSKVASTDKTDIEEDDNDENEEEEEEVFIAFARVFSGSLKKGTKLYVLGPKYDPMKGLSLKRHNEEEQIVDVDSISR